MRARCVPDSVIGWYVQGERRDGRGDSGGEPRAVSCSTRELLYVVAPSRTRTTRPCSHVRRGRVARGRGLGTP